MEEERISNEETTIMMDVSSEKESNEEYPSTREECIILIGKKEKEASLAAKMGRMLLESNKKLTETNESIMDQLERKKNQLDLTLQRISVLEEEFSESKRNNNLLESQNRQFCEANEKLLGELDSLEKEIIHLRNSSKEMDSIIVNRDSLRKELEEKELLIESNSETEIELRKKLKRLEEENLRIQSEKNSYQQEVFRLKEELECFHKDAKQSISSSNLQLESKLKELNLENFQLRQEIIQSQDQTEILRVLREENESLKREKYDHLELFQQSKDEIESMRRKLEKDEHQTAVSLQVTRIDAMSLFDELEEQVVSRVKADLMKAQSEGQLQEPEQELLTNTQSTISTVPSKIAEIEDMDQGNNLWVNFVSYLPALKSSQSTKDLVETLSNQQLKELLNVLSRVVNAYSGRLVEVLQERDEITREKEIRSAFVLQLTQGAKSPVLVRGRSNSNTPSPKSSPNPGRRITSISSPPSSPKKKSWFWPS